MLSLEHDARWDWGSSRTALEEGITHGAGYGKRGWSVAIHSTKATASRMTGNSSMGQDSILGAGSKRKRDSKGWDPCVRVRVGVFHTNQRFKPTPTPYPATGVYFSGGPKPPLPACTQPPLASGLAPAAPPHHGQTALRPCPSHGT